jgi:two-component system phosphate regulon response regulator PhoB
MKRAQTGACMSDRPTIILAPFDAGLASDLARRIPAARVGPLDAIAEAAGPLWLFIDWLLPESSGLELCRRLRAEPRTADARIFLVIEDDDRETRRRALKAGADDYVLGPLTAAAIAARVCEAAPLLPRAEHVLAHGPLKLDREAYQVRAGVSPVPMRPNEFLLLAFFLENRDRVVSRRELIGALKGGDQVDERTVDVWIGRLRRALVSAKVSDPIRTVRQLGYVYDSF